LRIIAGRLKGRRIASPSWEGLRPTSDRLRETLFNVLAPRIEGARVLDVFAGTGALGFEALSRGAAHVVFVESDRRAADAIARTASAWGVGRDYTIHVGDAVEWLRRLAHGPRFDLILLDPPYSLPQLRDALDAAAGCLSENGMLVLERATRREPDAVGSLERVRDLRAGDSTLTFYALAGARERPRE
jgi:16S rRNA (guanine(966)-N(2))-methyltransferase RsmD